MAPFYISPLQPLQSLQWTSAGSSCTYHGDGRYTFEDTSTYQVSRVPSYIRKREETRKERLIRWASAFKIFYSELEFVLIKTENDELAAYRETYKRRLKFKGQNRNLIL